MCTARKDLYSKKGCGQQKKGFGKKGCVQQQRMCTARQDLYSKKECVQQERACTARNGKIFIFSTELFLKQIPMMFINIISSTI